ncbi:putative glycoside hydrolase [Anaerocolumna sp.]|uniref:putative glycoside hydrolase n=1 Tax=Anaerocolumna sp. TaxID=2041569 RepID=UPI0028AD30C2|nr:putative glycoside hydrolase [Anaerocolumna sp.]
MRKKDMYLNYNNPYSGKNKRRGRRGYGRRGRRPNFLYILLILIIAIGLGFLAFYITNKVSSDSYQDLFGKKNKKSEINKDIDENKTEDGKTQEDIAGSKEAAQNSSQSVNPADNTQNSPVGNNNTNENDPLTEEEEAEDTMASAGKKKDAIQEEPFMPNFVDNRIPVKVKGIYVTGPRAGNETYMKELIKLVDTTELNAMVIDIKNDSGEITYNMDLDIVQEIGAPVKYIRDMEELIKELKEKDIYLIARIVAFKDPILAKGKPELSLKKKDGSVFKDKDGLSWVNPYKKEVWDYLIAVAGEAVKLGFDEIQFDYIRFSTDSGMKQVDFGEEAKDKTKIDAINEFTKYASEQLKPQGVYVSADVYGAIIDSEVDANIVGQDYIQMSKYLDYICPMIYPSHYADGAYGIAHPDLEPYNLILQALQKSEEQLSQIKEGNQKAVVRSWLQDFTAVWLKHHKSYGPEEIKEQIKAVNDAGYEEWILWNGNNNYTKGGLAKN